jgi:uncharacterized phiE125 gp8 family phage protein
MIIDKPLDSKGERRLYLVTAPTTEPVTLAEVKAFARIDGTTEDTLITGFITGVRGQMESYLRRALIEQTWAVQMDHWPDSPIELPMPPLISITSVVTIDEDDTETTYASTNYFVHTSSEPGELILRDDVTAPNNTDRYFGGYKITYKAGYGTAASDVPQMIRDGIKLWVTEFYENRITTAEPPMSVKKLVQSYRMLRI